MHAYCTTCGTRRAETDKFCSHCESRFGEEPDESRPARATDTPPGHGESWFVGISAILAIIVTSGILGANALVAHSLAVPEARIYGDSVGSDGLITSGPVDPVTEEAPTETWVPPPTEDETIETPTVPTVSSLPTVGNALVAVAPGAAQDPAAPAIVELLTAYFTAISTHDYVAYQAQHTRAVRATLTRKEFTTGYRSTVNSDVMLLGLSTAEDGRRLAEVSFFSRQDAADGPDGQTCTHWTVGKYLEGQDTNLLIGKPPSDYRSSHAAC